MSSPQFTRPGGFSVNDTSKANYQPSPSAVQEQAGIDALNARMATNDTLVSGHTAALAATNAALSSNTSTLNANVLPNKVDYKTVSITTGFGTTGTTKPTVDYWQHISTQGAHATLCVMVGITSATDPNPTMIADSLFASTLADARASGVPIDMVKLHLGTQYSDGFNRGDYLPSDVNAYFTNWQTICLHYASLCVQNNIPILCIGCEQPNQTSSTYLTKWQTIINAIKAQYPTLLLTYAPKTWEFTTVDNQGLFGLLDIIGVNVYLSYSLTPLSVATPSLDDLCKAFYGDRSQQNVIGTINQLANTYGKPFFITEIGCMPTDKGLSNVVPYDYQTQPTNYDSVYWLLKAAFTCLFRNRNVKGFAIWHAGAPFKYWDATYVTNAEQLMIDYVKGGLI